MRRFHSEAVGLASALLFVLVFSAFTGHYDETPQPSQQLAHETSGVAGQWEGSLPGFSCC